MGAYGLQTHIWNNNLKSLLLLAGFPLLILGLTYGLAFLYATSEAAQFGAAASFDSALAYFLRAAPVAAIGVAIWFSVAWFANTAMIRAAVGARPLERRDAPEIYNLLENLCIARGQKMPRLNIIPSPALNAFASGVDEGSYTITLTRGIIDRLEADELEAVLAHELTHIRNRDVRLLIVAVIFVGIFSFLAELLYRGVFRTGVRIGGHTRSRNGDSRGGGLLIIGAMVLIGIAYALAVVIRFALSRKREFLADAGAVDLTRNAPAMISALEKISGRSDVEAPPDVRQMMIVNARPFFGVFATHPPIEARGAALKAFV